VIFESWPWKQRLLGDADVVERWAKKRPSDRREFLIEHKVFLAAYSIRKLDQASKLSTAFRDRSIRCSIYPPVAQRINSANAHKFDRLYDFERPSQTRIAVLDLLDMLIHSLIFAELVGDDGSPVTGFLVTSEKSRFKGLWEISLADFLNLMRLVGGDIPSRASFVRGADGDWIVWQGHGEPPRHIREKHRKALAQLHKGRADGTDV